MASEKTGTFVPNAVAPVPNGLEQLTNEECYAAMVAASLHRHLGNAQHATKTVRRWTGASESAVKSWFSGKKAPGGWHLAALVRYSDPVLEGFLRLAGREHLLIGPNLADVQGKVRTILHLLEGLSLSDSRRDV